MALIPKPKFPNVPKLPGVPQLARSGIFPAGPPPILGLPTAIARLWQSLFVTPQWGVYDQDDKLRLHPDNIMAMSWRVDSSIPTFPVQRGSFANYNKVESPDNLSLRMTKSGSQQDRANFLSDCKFLARSLGLYKILTPERTYTSVNITRVELNREGVRGAYYFAEVDVYFQEIREVAAQYTTYAADTQNAQNPDAQGPANQGRVQGIVPPQGVRFNPAAALRITPAGPFGAS